EALAHLEKAQFVAKEIGSPRLELRTADLLANIYEQTNNLGKALKYSKRLTQLKSQMLLEEKHREVIRMEASVDLEKSEKEKEVFPKLSQTEIKVCALIRTALPTKDIANLFYTSVRTIEDHRLMIRRKLGLKGKDSLNDFIAKF